MRWQRWMSPTLWEIRYGALNLVLGPRHKRRLLEELEQLQAKAGRGTC